MAALGSLEKQAQKCSKKATKARFLRIGAVRDCGQMGPALCTGRITADINLKR